MRRVAGTIPLSISPRTWTAAIAVAALCVGGALSIATVIVSPERQASSRLAAVAPQSDQSPAPKAESIHRKTALPRIIPPRIEKPAEWETTVAPDMHEPVSRPPVVPDVEDPAVTEPPVAPDVTAATKVRGETGRASWYDFNTKTASGERMDGDALTAAHPSLPFGSKVKVANLDNGRSVVVRINDRGPFTKDRIIDVSRAAAAELGMIRAGVARVSVSLVEDEIAGTIEARAEAPAPGR